MFFPEGWGYFPAVKGGTLADFYYYLYLTLPYYLYSGLFQVDNVYTTTCFSLHVSQESWQAYSSDASFYLIDKYLIARRRASTFEKAEWPKEEVEQQDHVEFRQGSSWPAHLQTTKTPWQAWQARSAPTLLHTVRIYCLKQSNPIQSMSVHKSISYGTMVHKTPSQPSSLIRGL